MHQKQILRLFLLPALIFILYLLLATQSLAKDKDSSSQTLGNSDLHLPILMRSYPLQQLAFGRDLGGINTEIFLVNSDSSSEVNLTNSPDSDGGPRWDQSGTTIGFSSRRTGYMNIFLMDPDGSNQINISNSSADHHSFSFFP